MKDENQQDIDTIFENLNFLKLKQTSLMFLELPDSVLEKFSEKYSNVLIYLLNILDHQTSTKLVSKLTLNSILYLIEEEIRLLLLAEFKSEGEKFDELVKISFLLDKLDYIKNTDFAKEIPTKEIKDSLLTLWNRKKNKEYFIKFNYLYNFDKVQLYSLSELIMSKKPIVLLILMILTSGMVKQILLEIVVKNFPYLLEVLPPDLFELKFYTFLREDIEKIMNHLPEEVVSKLEYLEIVKRLEDGLDKIILELKETNLPETIKREKILNQIFEILLPETKEIQELLLIDLLNKGYLLPQESELLQLFLKKSN
ncbi:MAG: hypothetical protein ACK4UJ_08595 [Leptonema sp. (in: bacteria)]